MKTRADLLLVEQGLAGTRAQAQSLLLAGRVYWGERRIDKAGTQLPREAELELRGADRYVSRGGIKLEGALRTLAIPVSGRTCADIGASTGGFTDCLLQHGASKVYAVDVGQGQLADRLRIDSRVVVRERTNARNLAPGDFAERIDLMVVDASFIGIEKLLPALASVLTAGAQLLVLVKPQFEAGREQARKGRGVIRDPEIRQAAIDGARAAILGAGFELLGACDSSLPGPKGNLEHFVWATRTA
jgi:23S rRNA (cytidine1920-2'-O)/16S rRNA (cytidine1409-2'-O)-methyltransferase